MTFCADIAQTLPLAHAGHFIWTLYLPPVAIVIYSIIRTTRAERRAEREEQSSDPEEDAPAESEPRA